MATPKVPAQYQGAIAPDVFAKAAGKDGRLSAKEMGSLAGLLPAPPKGYQYTYQHSNPTAPLALKKDGTLGKTLGKAALITGGLIATAATGGTASPLLLAAIGAGTGAGVGAIDNGWKGAAIGAGTGALGGALGGVAGGAGATAGSAAAKQGIGQAAKSVLSNPQTYAAVGGQVVPGKAGAALSLAGGTGGGNMAGTGSSFGNVISTLAKDPNTYATLLKAYGAAGAGAAQGQAAERTNENSYQTNANNTETSRYATQQGNLVNTLGLNENATMNRANLGLQAPTTRANQVLKGSLMELLQPVKISHPRATIPTISGGLNGDVLSALARSAGKTLQTQGNDALVSKSDVPAPVDYTSKLSAAPEITPYKEPGAGETALGTTSTIANVLAALSKMGKGTQPTTGVPQRTDGTV